jgi:hypothetical protein
MRITEPDQGIHRMPITFAGRTSRKRGSFGLLLVSGGVLRISEITAVAHADDETFVLRRAARSRRDAGTVASAWGRSQIGVAATGGSLPMVIATHVIAMVEFPDAAGSGTSPCLRWGRP